MSSDPRGFLSFVEAQRARHAARFPALKVEILLTFMGTTSRPGTFATCSVHRLRAVAPGAAPSALRATLGGALPRAPGPGECVTVHLTRPERYQGYQVKSKPLAEGVAPAELYEAEGDGLVVKGAQIFTVHHSPYTLQFFDRVPLEDVQRVVTGLPHALVAVGETANLSPRFVFHTEVRDGRVTLFHGDGLALKTYMNLRKNRQETRLVLDLETGEGWALRGTVEEFAPPAHADAYEKICKGFQAGGWGRPSRCFKFTPDALEPLARRG